MILMFDGCGENLGTNPSAGLVPVGSCLDCNGSLGVGVGYGGGNCFTPIGSGGNPHRLLCGIDFTLYPYNGVAGGTGFAVGFHIKAPTALPSVGDAWIFEASNVTTPLGDFCWGWLDTDGSIYVSNGANSRVQTGTDITTGAWFYVEFIFPSGLLTGSVPVTLKVWASDGTLIESVSGNLTSSTFNAALPINDIFVGNSSVASIPGTPTPINGTPPYNPDSNIYIDNFYIANTTSPNAAPLGPVNVTYYVATAQGRVNQWQPIGTTPNFACVDGEPWESDQSNYCQDGTAGHEDVFVVANVPTLATIIAVESVFGCGFDSHGRIRLGIGNGSAEAFSGTDEGVPSTSSFLTEPRFKVFDTNPFTVAPWAPGDLNGSPGKIQAAIKTQSIT